MKSKVISLKFVSEADEPVGYLMVETDDEKFAKQTARRWGEIKLDSPFARVELHQGVLECNSQIELTHITILKPKTCHRKTYTLPYPTQKTCF